MDGFHLYGAMGLQYLKTNSDSGQAFLLYLWSRCDNPNRSHGFLSNLASRSRTKSFFLAWISLRTLSILKGGYYLGVSGYAPSIIVEAASPFSSCSLEPVTSKSIGRGFVSSPLRRPMKKQRRARQTNVHIYGFQLKAYNPTSINKTQGVPWLSTWQI